MKVVLAGGAGALGRRVADDLAARGDEVVVLTRRAQPGIAHRTVQWDGSTVGEWAGELRDAVVVNLAGELVDRRPTRENIALLTRSRVEPTRALVDAAATLDAPPRVWLQMSTLAIYGDRGDELLDESARPGDGPAQMAGVATAWEAAAAPTGAARTVVLRTGIVLDRDSHALARLAGLVRYGLGGRVGSGRQWVSWLHVDDFLSIVRTVIDDDELEGILHATSPSPVRNTELMETLRRELHRPWSPPTPAVLVRFGSVFLRTDPALALTGRCCIPRRLTERGFKFAVPHLGPALHDLLGPAG